MTALGLSYDALSSIASNLAIVGWIAIVLLPKSDLVVKVIARLVIPGLMALLYVVLLATHRGDVPQGGGLGSIDEMQLFFSVDGLMVVGWIHFMAWDLFAGTWEVEDSQKHGIAHLAVLPALAATFMLGPVGLLVYLLLRETSRLIRRRKRITA